MPVIRTADRLEVEKLLSLTAWSWGLPAPTTPRLRTTADAGPPRACRRDRPKAVECDARLREQRP